MGSLSTYTREKLIDHVLRGVLYTPLNTLYVALSTADPLDDGTGLTEPTAISYGRETITFGAAASGKIAQSAIVVFDQALDAGWGLITHYALMDAASAGNVLASGSFNPAPTVDQYKTLSIPSGEIYVEMATEISQYLSNKLLDLTFRNIPYSTPTIYAALATVDMVNTDDGGDISEFNMTGYGRIAFSDWAIAVDGVSSNNTEMSWGVLTGTSQILEAVVLVDSSGINTGNVLIFDNDISTVIDVGDNVKTDADNFTITLT